MARDLQMYSKIVAAYRALASDQMKQPSESNIDRAFIIAKAFTPTSWGGEGQEANAVFAEAVKQVNEQGFMFDVTEKSPTASFVARYGQEEVKALLNAAAVTLVGIEQENQRAFSDTNLEMLMTKMIQELYTGKNTLEAQKIKLTHGRSL